MNCLHGKKCHFLNSRKYYICQRVNLKVFDLKSCPLGRWYGLQSELTPSQKEEQKPGECSSCPAHDNGKCYHDGYFKGRSTQPGNCIKCPIGE